MFLEHLYSRLSVEFDVFRHTLNRKARHFHLLHSTCERMVSMRSFKREKYGFVNLLPKNREVDRLKFGHSNGEKGTLTRQSNGFRDVFNVHFSGLN